MQGDAAILTVRHTITWDNDKWDCRCGYTTMADGLAYNHFIQSSETQHSIITDIPYIEDGDFAHD